MDPDLLRDRIRALLDEREADPVPLAESLGRGRDYLTDFLKGRKRSLATDFVTRLSQVLRVPLSHLTSGDEDIPRPHPIPEPGPPINLDDLRAYLRSADQIPARVSSGGRGRKVERRIPVVGEVAAGIWREAPIRHVDDVSDWLDMDVAGYERAALRAFKVTGPSMNLLYPEGRFVVTAHPAEAGLRSGDHVVVERQKADLTEITLKEFVVEGGGRVALWPRSSHPDFQDPLFIKGNGDEADQIGVVIIGVVVADYNRRERPAMLMQERRAKVGFGRA